MVVISQYGSGEGSGRVTSRPTLQADFQEGSYGYRPKRSAYDAVERVADAIAQGKTRVLDVDLKSYFDNLRHHLVLAQVAKRVNDPKVLRVLKVILKASGKKGVGQGDVLAPLLSNLYLTEVDRMLERATEATREGAYTRLEYCRYAEIWSCWLTVTAVMAGCSRRPRSVFERNWPR